MISQFAINRLFYRLEACAAAGERCPFNDEINTDALGELARSGKIRVEVFRENWRVVTILMGSNAGRQTKEYPGGGMPYLVKTSAGTFRNGRPIETLSQRYGRQQPSKPRQF